MVTDDDNNNYAIIAYLIGDNKYKQIMFKRFFCKTDVIEEYRNMLNIYYNNKEFVMVMLNNQHEILTAWALDTPTKLIEAAKLALNLFENGGSLYIDKNLTMINLFGSQIYEEIITDASKMNLLLNNGVEISEISDIILEKD